MHRGGLLQSVSEGTRCCTARLSLLFVSVTMADMVLPSIHCDDEASIAALFQPSTSASSRSRSSSSGGGLTFKRLCGGCFWYLNQPQCLFCGFRSEAQGQGGWLYDLEFLRPFGGQLSQPL